MANTDWPGREVPKEYREVIHRLLDEQGWRYDSSRKGHPMLYPADGEARPIPVPTTPGKGRGWQNWIAQIRRAGGEVKQR